MGYIAISYFLKWVYFNKSKKVYIFDLTSSIKKQMTPKIACEIKEIKSIDDLKNYRKNIPLTTFIKFSIFLKHGCRGYFGTKDNELLSMCWITNLKKYCPYFYHKYLHEAPTDALSVFYAHTLEKYRGYRIFPYILSYILIREKENNINLIYACIDISNVPSQKAFERVGFRFAYFLKYLKLFGIKIYIKKCQKN